MALTAKDVVEQTVEILSAAVYYGTVPVVIYLGASRPTASFHRRRWRRCSKGLARATGPSELPCAVRVVRVCVCARGCGRVCGIAAGTRCGCVAVAESDHPQPALIRALCWSGWVGCLGGRGVLVCLSFAAARSLRLPKRCTYCGEC